MTQKILSQDNETITLEHQRLYYKSEDTINIYQASLLIFITVTFYKKNQY